MLEGISKEDEHHVLGLQGNLWTEHVLEDWHAEMQIYPRLFAISEVGWTMAENKDWPAFERRASVLSDVAREWGYVVYRPGLTNAEGLVEQIDAVGFEI